MKKIFLNISLILLVTIVATGTSSAQQADRSGDPVFDNFFTFAWDVSIPVGDKYVTDVSLAGAKLEYRKMINHNISVGLDLSWNSFYEYKTYQTYHVDAGMDITTDLYKYNYTLPIAATCHYYFNSNGIFKPFVGLGIGATYSTPRLYFNIYEFDGENWGFLMRPEIGTIIKFEPDGDMGVLLGARYSYSTNNEEFFKIDNLQAIGFQLGLVWLY